MIEYLKISVNIVVTINTCLCLCGCFILFVIFFKTQLLISTFESLRIKETFNLVSKESETKKRIASMITLNVTFILRNSNIYWEISEKLYDKISFFVTQNFVQKVHFSQEYKKIQFKKLVTNPIIFQTIDQKDYLKGSYHQSVVFM